MEDNKPGNHSAPLKITKLFGGGWRRPVKDDYGNKWCNCLIPKLISPFLEIGQAYCMRCKSSWYH